MGRVYKGQTKLRIRLLTDQNITGSTAQIKYEKPSRKTGVWGATIESYSDGIIYYDVVSGDIDEAGKWKFWAYITFAGGLVAPGHVAVVNIYEEGD